MTSISARNLSDITAICVITASHFLHMSNVSAALTNALTELDWSQTDVAEKAGINIGMMNRYVRGTGVLGEDNLDRLLHVLPNPHSNRLLAAYLRDLIPPGNEGLVTVKPNSSAREEAPNLPEGLDPELTRAITRLAQKAHVHTPVKDMLLHFAKLMCGEESAR